MRGNVARTVSEGRGFSNEPQYPAAVSPDWAEELLRSAAEAPGRTEMLVRRARLGLLTARNEPARSIKSAGQVMDIIWPATGTPAPGTAAWRRPSTRHAVQGRPEPADRAGHVPLAAVPASRKTAGHNRHSEIFREPLPPRSICSRLRWSAPGSAPTARPRRSRGLICMDLAETSGVGGPVSGENKGSPATVTTVHALPRGSSSRLELSRYRFAGPWRPSARGPQCVARASRTALSRRSDLACRTTSAK